MDTDSYMHSLLVANPLRESTLGEAVETLQLPSGSRGLDAGCGIGLQCLLLAQAVGLTGHVTGLDISTEFLNRGEEIVKKAGLSERISFQDGDIANLPFDNNTFDWFVSFFPPITLCLFITSKLCFHKGHFTPYRQYCGLIVNYTTNPRNALSHFPLSLHEAMIIERGKCDKAFLGFVV